jgi:hypothetical protein
MPSHVGVVHVTIWGLFLLRPSIPQAAQAWEMLREGGGTVSYGW